MRNILRLFGLAIPFALAALITSGDPAQSQTVISTACAALTNQYAAGQTGRPLTLDENGKTCVTGAGGGGGGLSVTDQATFTQATSQFTPGGGVFNDTATLSSGQQGTYRMTTKRAQIMDVDITGNALYNAITSPIPLNVQGTTTAQTGQTPGTSQTVPIVAAHVDAASKGGVAYGAMANYGTSPGAVKVDGVNAFVTNSVAVIGPTADGTAAATNPILISGTTDGTGTGAVAVPKITAGGVVSVDIATVNGVTTLTGAGAAGTGSQRSTTAQDATTIAGSAPGTAGTPSTNVVSVQGVTSGTPIPTNGAVNVTLTDCSGTVSTGNTAVNAFTAQTTLHGFTIINDDTTEVMWISFTTTAAASTVGSYPIPAPTATTFAGGGSFTSPPGMGTNHALSVVAATNGHKFSCTWW